MMALPGSVSAATDTVAVTATIESWISVNIIQATLPLGVLVTSAGGSVIGSATTSVQVGTNDTDGWTMTIEGEGSGAAGGLYSTIETHLIGTATPVGTGVDGYGAQATTTESGVSINGAYDLTGNTVGLIPQGSSPDIASGSAARALSHAFTLTVKASSATDNPAANDYGDTITLTATVIP